MMVDWVRPAHVARMTWEGAYHRLGTMYCHIIIVDDRNQYRRKAHRSRMGKRWVTMEALWFGRAEGNLLTKHRKTDIISTSKYLV
jgi:hypothetical protein